MLPGLSCSTDVEGSSQNPAFALIHWKWAVRGAKRAGTYVEGRNSGPTRSRFEETNTSTRRNEHEHSRPARESHLLYRSFTYLFTSLEKVPSLVLASFANCNSPSKACPFDLRHGGMIAAGSHQAGRDGDACVLSIVSDLNDTCTRYRWTKCISPMQSQ